MKTALVFLLVILAVVAIVGVALANIDRRFSITLEDGWRAEDVRAPKASSGWLIGARHVPRKYALIRQDYDVLVYINPRDHSFNISLQIEALAKDGSHLSLAGSWQGLCGLIGEVRTVIPGWETFFTRSDALGFLWAPEMLCSSQFREMKESLATEASNAPITVTIEDFDGTVLGVETIKFRIWANGYRIYFVLP